MVDYRRCGHGSAIPSSDCFSKWAPDTTRANSLPARKRTCGANSCNPCSCRFPAMVTAPSEFWTSAAGPAMWRALSLAMATMSRPWTAAAACCALPGASHRGNALPCASNYLPRKNFRSLIRPSIIATPPAWCIGSNISPRLSPKWCVSRVLPGSWHRSIRMPPCPLRKSWLTRREKCLNARDTRKLVAWATSAQLNRRFEEGHLRSLLTDAGLQSLTLEQRFGGMVWFWKGTVPARA